MGNKQQFKLANFTEQRPSCEVNSSSGSQENHGNLLNPKALLHKQPATHSCLYLLKKKKTHNYITTTVKRLVNIICRHSHRSMRYFLIQNKQFVHIKYIHDNTTFSPTLQLNTIFRQYHQYMNIFVVINTLYH